MLGIGVAEKLAEALPLIAPKGLAQAAALTGQILDIAVQIQICREAIVLRFQNCLPAGRRAGSGFKHCVTPYIQG
jgi:hypothetical protein